MKVATFNGCRVYNLSAGKTMPQWMTENKKRQMAKVGSEEKVVDYLINLIRYHLSLRRMRTIVRE